MYGDGLHVLRVSVQMPSSLNLLCFVSVQVPSSFIDLVFPRADAFIMHVPGGTPDSKRLALESLLQVLPLCPWSRDLFTECEYCVNVAAAL